jgi:mono/diheme cytochrome c family protein
MRGSSWFLLMVLCGAAAGAEEAKATDSGRALYTQHCASCHGPDGKGNGPVAAALKTPPPDLTRLVDKDGKFAADRVRTAIDGTQAATAHGSREMPVWGKVFAHSGTRRGEGGAATSVYALVEYLRQIQAAAPAPAK